MSDTDTEESGNKMSRRNRRKKKVVYVSKDDEIVKGDFNPERKSQKKREPNQKEEEAEIKHKLKKTKQTGK